jgi:hypothetical protein
VGRVQTKCIRFGQLPGVDKRGGLGRCSCRHMPDGCRRGAWTRGLHVTRASHIFPPRVQDPTVVHHRGCELVDRVARRADVPAVGVHYVRRSARVVVRADYGVWTVSKRRQSAVRRVAGSRSSYPCPYRAACLLIWFIRVSCRRRTVHTDFKTDTLSGQLNENTTRRPSSEDHIAEDASFISGTSSITVPSGTMGETQMFPP